MKINFDVVLRSLGKDLQDAGGVITLRRAASIALGTAPDSPKFKMTKYERGHLADRIYESQGVMEITAEEIAETKEAIDASWPPSAVYSASNALEGKETKLEAV